MIGYKKIFLLLRIIIVLTIVFFGQEYNETAKIIENCISASGGLALAAIKTEVRKGTLLRGVTGKVPLEIVAKTPGKWLYHQNFAWGDRVCYGFDGTTAWVQDTRGVSLMGPRQRLDLQLLLDVQAPLNIHKYYPEMAVKGSEKIGGREATTVTATSQDGIHTELAFDNETGLLLRAGEMFLEDYRNVGRVKRPFRILLGKAEGENHLQMKMQFIEIRHDLDVDDARFLPPVGALSFIEAPLFKRREQVEVGIEALEACAGEYQHPELPKVVFTVTRQQNHLMFQRTDWGRQKLEIKPESDTDYFMEFLNIEFHFIKDASGKVTYLEVRTERSVKAERIKQDLSLKNKNS